jgi:hypothetical protein
MKATFGKYTNRLVCHLHDRHMDKKYGIEKGQYNQSHEDYAIEAIESGIQRVYNVFNWIWFDRRTQKVKVRIDPWDTWGMDHTLAYIIHPMLVQLKATNHGYPNGLTEKQWDDIMDEMIWTFEQKLRDDWEGDYYEYREMGPEESKDHPESLFGLKLVWEDREGQAAHQERMTNGFKLFGKYYENLWD